MNLKLYFNKGSRATLLATLILTALPVSAKNEKKFNGPTASSSEQEIAKFIKTYAGKIGHRLPPSLPGFTTEGGNYPEYEKHIGKWQIIIGADKNSVIKYINLHADDNQYNPGPGDKYEQALDIMQKIFPTAICRKERDSSGPSTGNVDAPSGVTPDMYSSGRGYVKTTCEGDSKETSTFSISSDIRIRVHGYGGMRCIINKTGTVGQENPSSVSICIEK